ncbi:hypothetical protein V8C86DRAFT_2753341 [Haematococcus lacustris]
MLSPPPQLSPPPMASPPPPIVPISLTLLFTLPTAAALNTYNTRSSCNSTSIALVTLMNAYGASINLGTDVTCQSLTPAPCPRQVGATTECPGAYLHRGPSPSDQRPDAADGPARPLPVHGHLGRAMQQLPHGCVVDWRHCHQDMWSSTGGGHVLPPSRHQKVTPTSIPRGISSSSSPIL